MKRFLKRLKHFLFIVDAQFKVFSLVKTGHVMFGKVTATGIKVTNKYGTFNTVDSGYHSIDELIDIYHESSDFFEFVDPN